MAPPSGEAAGYEWLVVCCSTDRSKPLPQIKDGCSGENHSWLALSAYCSSLSKQEVTVRKGGSVYVTHRFADFFSLQSLKFCFAGSFLWRAPATPQILLPWRFRNTSVWAQLMPDLLTVCDHVANVAREPGRPFCCGRLQSKTLKLNRGIRRLSCPALKWELQTELRLISD